MFVLLHGQNIGCGQAIGRVNTVHLPRCSRATRLPPPSQTSPARVVKEIFQSATPAISGGGEITGVGGRSSG
ncbi:MAG: hypothetical protein JF609_01315 [Verrucomicrobia bacterium]|nr:hypothetical protein [Verrucomicrobiota bacterium]